MHRTAVQAVGINAAFLNEIKEDHIELQQLLAKLKRAFFNDNCQCREVNYLLPALRDQLAIHFSLEEAYGYCEDALDVAPWLTEKAIEIRAEHHQLFHRICLIAELAEGLLEQPQNSALLDRVISEFADFCQALDEHEQREIDLVLTAFGEDLGVGD